MRITRKTHSTKQTNYQTVWNYCQSERAGRWQLSLPAFPTGIASTSVPAKAHFRFSHRFLDRGRLEGPSRRKDLWRAACLFQKGRTLQEVHMVHPARSTLRPSQGTSPRGWDNLCILVTDGVVETHQRERLRIVSCMGHYQTLPAGPVATLTCSCFFGLCFANVSDHSSRKVNVTCFQL